MSVSAPHTVLSSETKKIECRGKCISSTNIMGRTVHIYKFEKEFCFGKGDTATLIFSNSKEGEMPEYPSSFTIKLLIEKFKTQGGTKGYKITPQNISSIVITPNLKKYLMSDERPGNTFYKIKKAPDSQRCLIQ